MAFESENENMEYMEIEGNPNMENLDDEVEIEVEDEELENEELDTEEDETEDDDIEIVDDTPEEDQGRTVSEPLEEVSEEELKNLTASAANKIRRAHKSYHDERRAKEKAEREMQEAMRVAKKLYEENQKLTATSSKSEEQLVGQAKINVESQLAQAEREYTDAYDSGDSAAMLKAQKKLIKASSDLDRINAWKPKPVQPAQPVVQQELTESQPIQRDEKAEKWREKNDWFGKNTRMTAYALGLHQELVEEGIDPKSDEYYAKLNKDLRATFPQAFPKPVTDANKGPKPDPTVVSPANRSAAGGKIKLTKSALNIAKQLGLTPRQYADQLKEDRKRNG